MDWTPEHHRFSSLGKKMAMGPNIDASQVILSFTSYLQPVCGLLSDAWNPSLFVMSSLLIFGNETTCIYLALYRLYSASMSSWFSQQLYGVANKWELSVLHGAKWHLSINGFATDYNTQKIKTLLQATYKPATYSIFPLHILKRLRILKCLITCLSGRACKEEKQWEWWAGSWVSLVSLVPRQSMVHSWFPSSKLMICLLKY